MASHTPYSVILTCAEDQQRFIVHAVDQTRIATVTAGQLEMPILLDSFDYRLDDEFARRLGVAMLNLIALGQPDIRQYISVTQEPIDKPLQT